jgi:solute carrier family 25 oxoglutarate transporter 11
MSPSSTAPVSAVVPLQTRMVLGALSGMGAATFCHPLDVVRVRLQTGGQGSILQTTMVAYQQGGLYAGIGAAYLRQWTYGACRMGIYSYLLEQAKATTHDGSAEAVPFSSKLGMGMLSGGIGSFFGTPSALALVRLTNDGKLPPSERRNYKGVVDCLRRIALEEGGFRAWWTGATPTVCRATVLSACLMGGTSQAKSALKSTGKFEHKQQQQQQQHQQQQRHYQDDYKGDWLNGIPLLFCSTLISSFCASVVANPFDVVKSRMQNMPLPAIGEAPLYKGSLDCLRKSKASEGVAVLSKGFGPAFMKLAPYSVISLTLVDTMTKAITGKEAL